MPENFNGLPFSRYMAIEGNIGAGKTSLARKLASDFNLKFISEKFIKNPFLKKFYENPSKYAFQVEFSFLTERYAQLKHKIIPSIKGEKPLVSDYCIEKCIVFANCNLHGYQLKIFNKMFDTLTDDIVKPDIYLYLHLKPERLMENIKKRSRSFESDINIDYLHSIEEMYWRYFEGNNEFRTLILDVGNIDFVNNESDYQQLKTVLLNLGCWIGIKKVTL